MLKRPVFLLLLFSILCAPALAQKKVKLKKADKLRGGTGSNGERVDWVVGNVVFVQNKTTIYCDSAQIYRERNAVDAYGRIRITEGDSVTVTAKSLSYDGNEKIAYLRRNVVFTKLNTAVLYTDHLDYYRNKNLARYFDGGKLVDSTNTLTSKKGYYDVGTNLASFKTEVVGYNKDYTLNSDTLQYNSKTKIVYFRDLTKVVDKDGQTAIYQNGYYDTSKKKSDINQGDIETPTYKMKGDNYFLDDFRKFYKAQRNVVMTSKEENMIIYGDDGYYDKKNGVSKVWNNAYVAKIAEDGDTLFLSADTLVSIEHKDPRKKRVLAYNHVRIFKTDLQGVADSLAYVPIDSMIYFYKDPVLWNDGNQMTGDSIRLLLKQKKIDRIYLVNNSFVVSQDSLTNFNQIKGRKMTALFVESKIHHVDVDGNGESIYFALDEKELKSDTALYKVTYMMGMNRIVCSNMKINFLEGKLNNISFYKMPDAKFIPPHELKEPDTKLRGFIWRGKDRPVKTDVVKAKKDKQRPLSQ